jgi:hypothetical protein
MKRIYTFFCIFFAGSVLPFLIVEWYFQDYFTLGLLTLMTSVVLTFSVSVEYLKGKVLRWSDLRNKKINYLDWAQKSKETEEASLYYFRNYL